MEDFFLRGTTEGVPFCGSRAMSAPLEAKPGLIRVAQAGRDDSRRHPAAPGLRRPSGVLCKRQAVSSQHLAKGSGPATAPVQGVREEWEAWDVQERRTALSTGWVYGSGVEELILAVEAAKTIATFRHS